MSKISISSKVLLYTVAIRRIRYQPVEKKKKRKKYTFRSGARLTSSNLQMCHSSGSGWVPPVRMWRLLPPWGQAPLRSQHHLLLPLGLIYREHLQESVMRKGEEQSDNPNTQKVLCHLRLVNFTTKRGKKRKNERKKKKPSPAGRHIHVTQLGSGLQAWQSPRPVCFDCNVRLSCRCGWFRLNGSPVVQRSPQKPDHNNQSLVIYHNRIQNHKRQSSLKYIPDSVYLFIKACQGFVITQLALESQCNQAAWAKHQTRLAHKRRWITQKPNPEAREKVFSPPGHLSFHFHSELIFNYTWVSELWVIDGCEIF